MRSAQRNTNDLILLVTSGTISHYWQDLASTIWRSHVSATNCKPHITNFDSYTSHIHFQWDEVTLDQKVKMQVTSSEWKYLTISNIVHSIDETTLALAETDGWEISPLFQAPCVWLPLPFIFKASSSYSIPFRT
jgi:hypothetical protein